MEAPYETVVDILCRHLPQRFAWLPGVPDNNGDRYAKRWRDPRPHGSSSYKSYRQWLRKRYAFAVPSPLALERIASYSPLVEIGAGTGYWAKRLTDYGADVIAYDAAPHTGNAYGLRARYFPVRRGGPYTLAHVSPKRALMLSWPPYDRPMADRALARYRGQTVVYIGEGQGGCTGDDAFHERLEREWEQVETIAIPQWEGLHDKVYIYSRR